MSAERLRRVAAEMREWAEDAATDLYGKPSDERVWRGIGTGYRTPIKRHIAAMSPPVALAVAKVLDSAALLWICREDVHDDPADCCCCKHQVDVLAVCDAWEAGQR